MRFARLLLLTVAVLGMTQSTFAKCPRTQDGYVVCNAHCTYPANCLAGGGGYCYKDIVVDACFDGGYDPCCDTAGLF
jgi:hypothetical protein